MRKTTLRNLSALILCAGLFAAMALGMTGCAAGQPGASAAPPATEPAAVTEAPETDPPATEGPTGEPSQGTETTELGEGATEFIVTVTDGEGNESRFLIHTDETTVGDALLAVDLIAGEESEYGLYVKTVNGITADYDTDGTYWAFYIDGEYASSGVDATDVAAGAVYSFAVEK